jgi:hypothetical protein
MTNEIDLAEFNSREAAKFSFDGLSTARERAHQLMLVLLGGGAGLGALGLERWDHSPVLAGAAIGAALLWFALARQVAKGALVSMPVRAWAQEGLMEKHAGWATYSSELLAEGKPPVDPLVELRRSSIRSVDKAAAEYRAASNAAYDCIDNAYRSMSTTPFAASLGAGAGWIVARCL